MIAPTRGDAVSQQEPLSIWQVHVEGPDDVAILKSGRYDLLEGSGDGYLLVLGENTVALELQAAGLRVTRDRELAPLTGVARSIDAEGEIIAAAATYFGGYRTVDEHYAHLAAVEASYPNLATVYDYGDSWRKVNGRANPNDLMVICLTNKQPGDCALSPNSAKPRAVIQAAIHARELQTSEVAWRLIDELTQKYGIDANITHMMDTTEIWVIPVVNPDGREIVEGGGNSPYLQRKNANDSRGNCPFPPSSNNQHGIDLNRNAATYDYGRTGSSTNPCAQTYRGTGPASEPEQASLETLFANLWPDQKGAPADPVATTATGTFITLHSFGNLVFMPPGGGGQTPNDAELRALGFRMSHYNGYRTGTGPEILYEVSGVTDDYAYFALGVASFTYEIGPTSGTCGGFTPAYTCIDSTLWPANRDALLYSIKVAGSPYVTPRGPTTTSISAPPTVEAGSPLALSAMVDDDAFGNAGGSFGRPSARNVTQAEYYIDASHLQGGSPVAMTSSDGIFNEPAENVQASVPTTGLAPGQHTAFVRGRSAGGFWGPVTAVSFNVTAPAGSEVAGRVTFSDGSPVEGVSVDLFNEGRTQWLAATSSGGNGNYNFTLPNAGCYVITFIAGDGRTFAASGNQYLNQDLCVDPGETITGIDASITLPGSETIATGQIAFTDNTPAEGVAIDLFTEGRTSWLGSTTTDDDGNYTLTLPGDGCYVNTAIAPDDTTFTNGSPYANLSYCAAAGQEVANLNVTLVGTAAQAIIGDLVSNTGGDPEAGALVVLYQANGDGGRGQWLDSAISDVNGAYQLITQPGCKVVDFVAPPGRTWAATNGQYYQVSFCLEAGETNTTIDAILN